MSISSGLIVAAVAARIPGVQQRMWDMLSPPGSGLYFRLRPPEPGIPITSMESIATTRYDSTKGVIHDRLFTPSCTVRCRTP